MDNLIISSDNPIHPGGHDIGNVNFSPEVVNLAEEAMTVIEDRVQPALKRLVVFLLEQYTPRCRPQPGVHCLSRGKEYYQACLRWHLSLTVHPGELHELGLAEIARIRCLMEQVMVARGFMGTLKEFLAHLKEDGSLYMSSDQEVVGEVRRIIEENIRPKLGEYFFAVPDMTRMELVASDAGSGGGFYTPASRDARIPGRFSVCRPRTLAKHTLVSLVAHETAHHIQRAYSLARQLPTFRLERHVKYYAAPFHVPFYTAYVEGWGCYAECLGEEMGLYRDKLDWFGRYSDDMLRAARIVVDTGIHFYGWTRQEAIDYLSELVCDPIGDIQNEVDRYIVWPGHACAYKFGELKIRELRHLAEVQLGERFNIRGFHDVVLSLGPAPLYTLERVVGEWIKAGGVDMRDIREVE